MATRRRDSFASTFRAELVRAAQEHDVDESRAMRIAMKVVQRVVQHYQGNEVYVGQLRYDAAAVLRDFNGGNHDAVCLEHGISRRTLHRIVRLHRRD